MASIIAVREMQPLYPGPVWGHLYIYYFIKSLDFPVRLN